MKINLLLTLSLLTVSVTVAQPVLQWTKGTGGTANDYGYQVAMDTSGNVYTIGIFGGTADFDPGSASFNMTATAQQDVFISKLDASGNFMWAKRVGGTESSAGSSIAIDNSGNVYATGFFGGTADFDPDTGKFSITANGSSDVFVLKLDANGKFLWVARAGGFGLDIGSFIDLDANGNIIYAGHFSNTVDFDPGAGTDILTSAGGTDMFFSKLDAWGNYAWTKRIGGTSNESVTSIVLDGKNNVHATGAFQGTVDFDPGAGTFPLTAKGYDDIFVAKFDTNGGLTWARQMGSTSQNTGMSIALDAIGNVITIGRFYGTADFDPGSGTSNISAVGMDDVFISKLDTGGNFVWVKGIGGASTEIGSCVLTDAFGNIYVSGHFMLSVDFDPGSGIYNLVSAGSIDMYVLKLNASGNFKWVYKIGGALEEIGKSMLLDKKGNLHLTGSFRGTVDFDPGSGTSNLTAAGNYDAYVLKMGLPATGINDIKAESKLLICPNPNNGIFTIMSFNKGFSAGIEIYNSLGVLVDHRGTINDSDIIDLRSLPNGLYIVRIIEDDQSINFQTLSIQH